MTINLKALSEHLGLSPTTVSRALGGYPEVSARTRQRVLEAARDLNYTPNNAARRLATGKANTFGYVLVTGSGVQGDPHFIEFLAGIGEYATEQGLDIHIAPCTPEKQDATYRRLVNTRQADAVFVSSPTFNDPRIALLKTLDFPFIVHGRDSDDDTSFSFLDIDNEGAFRDATRLLLNLGHRRIGLINGEKCLTFADRRARGFMKALTEWGIAADPALISSDVMSEEYGYRSAIAMLDAPDPPTALLCTSVVVALGATRALGDRGLEAGRDISMIAHDDVLPHLKSENFRVPLTCTRSSIRKAGFRIAERMAALASGEETQGTSEIWPVELVARASTQGVRGK